MQHSTPSCPPLGLSKPYALLSLLQCTSLMLLQKLAEYREQREHEQRRVSTPSRPDVVNTSRPCMICMARKACRRREWIIAQHVKAHESIPRPTRLTVGESCNPVTCPQNALPYLPYGKPWQSQHEKPDSGGKVSGTASNQMLSYPNILWSMLSRVMTFKREVKLSSFNSFNHHNASVCCIQLCRKHGTRAVQIRNDLRRAQ